MEYIIKKNYEKKIKKQTKFEIGDIVSTETDMGITIYEIGYIIIDKETGNIAYSSKYDKEIRGYEEGLTLVK